MSGDDQQRQLPRLAISDLLLLTLIVGLVLACLSPATRGLSQQPGLTLGIAMAAVDYIAAGALLFGLIVLVRERVRGNNVPSSPGHWLLVAIGPVGVASILGNTIAPLIDGWGSVPFNNAKFLSSIAIIFVSLCISLTGIRRIEWRWRVGLALVFCWLCVLAAIYLAFVIKRSWLSLRHLTAISASIYLVAATVIGIAVVVDASKGLRRDWLHFLAIVAFEMSAGTTVVNLGGFLLKWWRDFYLFLTP